MAPELRQLFSLWAVKFMFRTSDMCTEIGPPNSASCGIPLPGCPHRVSKLRRCYTTLLARPRRVSEFQARPRPVSVVSVSTPAHCQFREALCTHCLRRVWGRVKCKYSERNARVTQRKLCASFLICYRHSCGDEIDLEAS